MKPIRKAIQKALNPDMSNDFNDNLIKVGRNSLMCFEW